MRLVPGICLFALLGCASHDVRAPDTNVPVRSASLDYDALELEFLEETPVAADVGVSGAAAGAGEGARMMLAAPVGCMQAGTLYAFCLAAAPLFPVLAAVRAQDAQVSAGEMQALADYLKERGLLELIRQRAHRLASDASLPVATTAGTTGHSLRLRTAIGPISLQHSGYKDGQITVTVPYRHELLDARGELLAVNMARQAGIFDVDEWQQDAQVDVRLAAWVDAIARDGLQRMLVEWQPRIVLAPVTPSFRNRRNVIGIRQDFWSFADSTSPLLEWQPLQEAMDPVAMESVTDVSYELRIVAAGGAVLYESTALDSPSHRVGIELQACAYYYWQPIARFRYRGMPFTTSLRTRKWSEDLTLDHYYLLQTPGPRCKSSGLRAGASGMVEGRPRGEIPHGE